jgi:uncharacterized membrane protein
MISDERGRGSRFFVAESGQRPPSSSKATHAYSWFDLASACLIVCANVLVATGIHCPFVDASIGFWFLVIYPAYLLDTSSIWERCSVIERLGYSLCAVLLLLMLAGLSINTVLPFLGLLRPLNPIPVLVLGDALNVSLYLFRLKHPSKIVWRTQLKTVRARESRLIVWAGISVAFAILGANRLNNGVGDQVTLMALGAAVVTLIFLLRWRDQIREWAIGATLYLLSAALLLMTSLRGWYVTGHDIQQEYLVFQLTQDHGRWNISYFHNPYNACLSITILPTEIAQITHVYSPYVYKVFFQLLFALCPVLVYAIARRYWSSWNAILAVVYFIGFPTFVGDMPFINRQEVAFLFVCVAILSITNIWWGPRRKRLVFFIAAIGIELSHYSTMYVFIGTLLAAWAGYQVIKLSRSLRHRSSHASHAKHAASWQIMARTVGIGSILVLAGIALAWGGLATKTAGSAFTDTESSVSGFISGGQSGARSNDIAYSIFGGNAESPQTLLNDYRQQTIKERSSSPSIYLPLSEAIRYPTPVVDQPSLPLTTIGRFLSRARIPIAGLNSALREAAADGEQLFVGIGLISLAVTQRLRARMSREVFYLCVGTIFMLAVLTELPDLSVDYGILRAFQEALILIAPVLVLGSTMTFRLFGELWATRIAAVICMSIFISTTGLLPQITGGYPAQLNLNNSGLYYELYYTHPQEVSAVKWLARQPDVFAVIADGVQAPPAENRFNFTSPSNITGTESIADIYPTLIARSSWVILSYSTLRTDLAVAAYNGDLITYAYPIKFLQITKNLVYNDGGAEIYR